MRLIVSYCENLLMVLVVVVISKVHWKVSVTLVLVNVEVEAADWLPSKELRDTLKSPLL